MFALREPMPTEVLLIIGTGSLSAVGLAVALLGLRGRRSERALTAFWTYAACVNALHCAIVIGGFLLLHARY